MDLNLKLVNTYNLEEKTRCYWLVGSLSRNAKFTYSSVVTTEQAISTLNACLESLGPHNKVKGKISMLLDDIVSGAPSQHRGQA